MVLKMPGRWYGVGWQLAAPEPFAPVWLLWCSSFIVLDLI